MLYDYLKENFSNSEPIFLSEIKGYSDDYLRQEMKRLVDGGKLERLYNGVYYIPYKTILGTKGKVSIKKYVDKKYICNTEGVFGYYTGLTLANKLGLTSQNPACYEVCSNAASTKQRKQVIDGFNVVVYEPIAEVTSQNYKELQFLDLMSCIEKYCELNEEEIIIKLKKYVSENNIDFSVVRKYISLYPDKVYKNIYNGGLMNELV